MGNKTRFSETNDHKKLKEVISKLKEMKIYVPAIALEIAGNRDPKKVQGVIYRMIDDNANPSEVGQMADDIKQAFSSKLKGEGLTDRQWLEKLENMMQEGIKLLITVSEDIKSIKNNMRALSQQK